MNKAWALTILVLAGIAACGEQPVGIEDSGFNVEFISATSLGGEEALTSTIQALANMPAEKRINTTAGDLLPTEVLTLLEATLEPAVSETPDILAAGGEYIRVSGYSDIAVSGPPPYYREVVYSAASWCAQDCGPTFSMWTSGDMTMSFTGIGGDWSDTHSFGNFGSYATGNYSIGVAGDEGSAFLSTRHQTCYTFFCDTATTIANRDNA